jgi:hypothetical protein
MVVKRWSQVSCTGRLRGLTAIGKPRMSAAGVGGPALRLEAGFFVEP